MVAIAAEIKELVHEVYKATNITGKGATLYKSWGRHPSTGAGFLSIYSTYFFLAEGTFARRFGPQNRVVLSTNNDQMKGESLSDPTYWWMK